MMSKSNIVSSALRFPSSKNVHADVSRNVSRYKPLNSILEHIGNTPLVKLQRIPRDHGVGDFNIYVKCEYLNPGGSIKDRICFTMTEDAIKNHAVQSRTFVEATSGNTGIATVMNAAVRNHKAVIVTQKSCSDEKLGIMRVMGAHIVFIKSGQKEMETTMKFLEKGNNSNEYIMLDQFENNMNPTTHYSTTGPEIWQALESVDAVVMVAGTGGTMTGVATYLKSKKPNIVIVAGDIEGSQIFHNGRKHPYLVEGVYSDSYPPETLDKSLVDRVEIVSDKESFLMARELARKEGILCGGSSGMAVASAVRFAQYLSGSDHKIKDIVVILPDGIRNYMSKFGTEQWMEAHFFQDPPAHNMGWYNALITDSDNNDFIKYGGVSKAVIVPDNIKLKDAWTEISTWGTVFIVDHKSINTDDQKMVGAISEDSLRYNATNPTQWPGEKEEELDWNAPVTHYMEHYTYSLPTNTNEIKVTVGLLARILDITRFVVIGTLFSDHSDENPVYFNPKYIAKASNVVNYIRNYK